MFAAVSRNLLFSFFLSLGSTNSYTTVEWIQSKQTLWNPKWTEKIKSIKCVTQNKTATVYCDVQVTGYKSTETHSTLKSEPQQLVYHSMGVFHMSHFPPIYLKPLGIQIHSCSF